MHSEFVLSLDICYDVVMTQAIIEKKINKTAGEMNTLIKKSKRKLLELEVMLSLGEIKKGKFKVFRNTKELFRKLK